MRSIKNIILSIILMSGLYFSCLAQVITFKKNYGYLINNDYGRYIQQTSDGGYIIVGNTDNQNQGADFDIFVVKIDSLGNTQWTRQYNTLQKDKANFIQETNDNNYLIVGETGYNIFVIKLDNQGDTIWTKIYEGRNGTSSVSTYDGNYLITGKKSYSKYDTDILVIKINEQGDTICTKTYGKSNIIEAPSSIIKASDSGYIITGGCGYLYLLKINNNLDSLWFKTVNSPEYATGYDVSLTSDGGYIIVGQTCGTPPDYEIVTYLVKTDENGDTLWTKTYIGSNNYGSDGYSVRQTNDGGFIIAGWIYEDNINWNQYIYLMKTNANGDSLWTKTFKCVPGLSYLKDAAFCVRQTNDQGYILAGQKYMGAWGGYDMYVIKTDSLGNVYNTSEIENELIIPHIKLKIFPNPFSNKTTIKFRLYESGEVKLKVYNYTGECIATLFDKTANAGQVYKIEFDTKKLSAGVYYGVLQTDNKQITKKMVIIK